MNQLSLLPTDPLGNTLADPSRSPPAQAALAATARASDSPLAQQGALEHMLAPLPEAL